MAESANCKYPREAVGTTICAAMSTKAKASRRSRRRSYMRGGGGRRLALRTVYVLNERCRKRQRTARTPRRFASNWSARNADRSWSARSPLPLSGVSRVPAVMHESVMASSPTNLAGARAHCIRKRRRDCLWCPEDDGSRRRCGPGRN